MSRDPETRAPGDATNPGGPDRRRDVPPVPRRHGGILALSLLALFALAVRVATQLELSVRDPDFSTPVVDELTNFRSACAIARGERPALPFWKPPLYDFYLAAFLWPDPPRNDAQLYGPEAPSPWPVKLSQALLDALTALLVVAIARRVLPTRGGERSVPLLAGAIYACAFTPVYFTAQLLDTTLAAFLVTLAILALLRASEREDGSPWLLAGIVLGLAGIARAPSLLLLPIAAIVPLVAPRGEAQPRLGRLAHAALLVTGCAAAVAPVTIANWKLGGDRILVSSNGGINFYIGNRRGDGPGADGLTSVSAGPRWRELLSRVDADQPPSARSRAYYRLAAGEIAAAPGEFLARLAVKTLALVSAFEVPNNKNFREERERSWALTLLPIRTGILIPLALAGFVALGRRLRHRWILLGSLGVQALGVIAFFVAARYRVPLVPLLCVGAAGALHLMWTRAPGARRAALVAAVALVVAHLDITGARERYRDYVVDPVALAHASERRAERLATAIRDLPDDDPTSARRMRERLRASAAAELERAERLYRRAKELDPVYPEADHNLAHMEFRRGRRRDAVERLRGALADSPWFAEGWNTLGSFLLAAPEFGAVSEAERCFRRAITEDPRYAKARANLGQLFERAGLLPDAREEYQTARRLEPSEPLYALLEARALLHMGQARAARNLMRKAEQEPVLSTGTRALLRELRARLRAAESPPASGDAH